VAGWAPGVSYEAQGESGHLRVIQPEVDGLSMRETRNSWELQFSNQVPMEMTITLGAGDSDLALSDLNLQRLNLQTGAGMATVAVPGTLSDLVVESGAGQVNLDLSGDWMQDLEAQIGSGVGQISVLLPAGAGVRVAIEQGLGQINAPRLSQQGEYLVNEAYGESENTLTLMITGGIGQINLQVEE
jgi:hypothetical protein